MGRTTLSKTLMWKAMALGAGLGLGMLSYPVHATPASGGDTVQGLYEVLLSTMKNGRILGQSGRFTQLDPVIRRSFDIASMARLSVGPTWASLSDAQRQQMTESFARYISATYADRFDSYAGQKLEVTGEQPAPAGVMVKSQIIKANGEPVKVDYMMRRTGDGWLISDIYLDGAISEVATRRSEFATILRNEGIDGLIAALNRKADILTGTSSRASYNRLELRQVLRGRRITTKPICAKRLDRLLSLPGFGRVVGTRRLDRVQPVNVGERHCASRGNRRSLGTRVAGG